MKTENGKIANANSLAAPPEKGRKPSSCLKRLFLFGIALFCVGVVALVCVVFFAAKDVSELTPDEIGYELATQSDENGFVIAGRNETEAVRTIESLNGVSLEELENLMRPGTYKPGGSESGFLGADEHLIDVLVADNERIVDQWGLTHQQIARPLLDLGYLARSHDVPLVHYRGGLYLLSSVSFAGVQESPFGDDTQTNTDVTIWNLKNGASISYSLLVPHMIHRYGFYEGHGTSYRVDPAQVVKFFGLDD